MSAWHLESVLDVNSNLTLEFGQNQFSNCWDIADIEFLWGGGGGVVWKVIFMSNPTYGYVRLS